MKGSALRSSYREGALSIVSGCGGRGAGPGNAISGTNGAAAADPAVGEELFFDAGHGFAMPDRSWPARIAE